MIANFGGNDAQAMVLDDGRIARFGRPEWEASYRAAGGPHRRSSAAAAGARVVLLGMSTTRDPGAVPAHGPHQHADRGGRPRSAGALFLSTWDVGADARGNYQDVTVVDGVPIRTRLADGKHFSRAGAAWAADVILERMAAVVPLSRERRYN